MNKQETYPFFVGGVVLLFVAGTAIFDKTSTLLGNIVVGLCLVCGFFWILVGIKKCYAIHKDEDR